MPSKAFDFNLRDADLLKSIALPAAASTSVTTARIDTGVRESRARLMNVAAALAVPALSATIIPDTRTVTLTIEMDSDSAFGSPTTIGTKVLTGAGGGGAAASELQITLPAECERYVRGKVAFGASTTDGSALSAEFSLRRHGAV